MRRRERVHPQHGQQPRLHHRGAARSCSRRSSGGSTVSPSRSSPTCRGAPPPSSCSTSWASAKAPAEMHPARLEHGKWSFGPSLQLLADAPRHRRSTASRPAASSRWPGPTSRSPQARSRQARWPGSAPWSRRPAAASPSSPSRPAGTARATSSRPGTCGTPAGGCRSTATRPSTSTCASRSRIEEMAEHSPGYTAHRAVERGRGRVRGAARHPHHLRPPPGPRPIQVNPHTFLRPLAEKTAARCRKKRWFQVTAPSTLSSMMASLSSPRPSAPRRCARRTAAPGAAPARCSSNWTGLATSSYSVPSVGLRPRR